MATRATYRFKNQFAGNPVFYIHWDGYPEGAASYFKNSIDLMNKNDQMNHSEKLYAINSTSADIFFRANPLAEHTKSHQAHGDTEYRYDYDDEKDILKVSKLTNWETGEFSKWWSGPLKEFVEKFGT